MNQPSSMRELIISGNTTHLKASIAKASNTNTFACLIIPCDLRSSGRSTPTVRKNTDVTASVRRSTAFPRPGSEVYLQASNPSGGI